MRVKVKVFASLREALGRGELVVELGGGSRLLDLLKELVERWPEAFSPALRGGRPVEGYSVMVNRRRVEDLDVELRDGDVVAILPPLGGG